MSQDPFQNLPPISFANVDVVSLTNEIVTAFQEAWLAQTNEVLVLGPSDRRYHFLLSLTAYFVSAFEAFDLACKQNTLPYASGGFLDVLGSLYGSRGARIPATGSTTTLKFTLPGLLPGISDIPAGTQVQSSDATGYVFATDFDLQIQPGSLVGFVAATCISLDPATITTVNPTGNVAGLSGNNIAIGAISNLVGWTGTFTPTVSNISVTSDGVDTELDSVYAARLYGSLGSYGGVDDSFSNQVGSYGAYQFVAQSVPGVSEVSVSGPEDSTVSFPINPGQVVLTVLGPGGTTPSSDLLAAVNAAVTPDSVRPLTDYVTVQSPSGVPFSVNVQYYVPQSLATNLVTVQSDVAGAVNTFISNVTTTLSAEIDPSVLTAQMVDAGAIRVVVVQPAFMALSKQQQAILVDDPIIIYEGLG